MTDPLPFDDLETAFDLIAAAIERAGPKRETLLLAKLSLALAHRLGDLDALRDALAIAERDLDRADA